MCLQGKLISGVFNNNILHVSNFVQSSFFLSQKGIYVFCLYTLYLTQTGMTLEGSICTFSELQCLGRGSHYWRSYCRTEVENFLVERLFIAVPFNKVAVYLKLLGLTTEALGRDALFWLNHSSFSIFCITKCSVTSSVIRTGNSTQRYFQSVYALWETVTNKKYFSLDHIES